MRLTATFDHPLREQYARPGGPWDVPTLDTLRADDGGTIVDDPLVLAGGQGDAAARALAGGLRARGVRRGDVVSWQLPNWHEAILLYRACWLPGARAGPPDPKPAGADT